MPLLCCHKNYTQEKVNGVFIEKNVENKKFLQAIVTKIFHHKTDMYDDGSFYVQVFPDKYIGDKYVGYPVEDPVKVIKAGSEGVSLGTISFNIVDPIGLSEMDSEALLKILSLDSTIAYIMYVDDDGEAEFLEGIDYEWKVDKILFDVEPTIAESSVSAYTIYNDGTEDDLIAYLNQNMNSIMQKYTDGQQTLDKIIWDNDPASEKELSIIDFEDLPCGYNPKGGKYKITQKYTDVFEITVKVTVTPVYLNGFNYISKNNSNHQ